MKPDNTPLFPKKVHNTLDIYLIQNTLNVMEQIDMKDNIPKSTLVLKIQNSIPKGLSFLNKSQLPSGEFPTYVADNADMRNCQYIKTIAMTALVADCLKYVGDHAKALEMIEKSIKFLLDERENEYIWRFFGKGSDIVPDLDDISYTLTVLKENKIDLNYEKFADKLLKNRNEEDLFYTWLSEKGKNNNVDWVTNTNMLYYFYSINKGPIPEVENYLSKLIKEGKFADGSLYYHTPYSFIYFFTRLYSKANSKQIDSARSIIIDFLLEQKEKNNCRSLIDYILATIGLINCNFAGEGLDKSIEETLTKQNQDGSWPIGSLFRHRTINRYYGSRQLTTALSIEALAKYVKRELMKC